MVIISFFAADLFVTSYASFDWYYPAYKKWYLVFNFTYIHILEVILLGICAYVHR
jgi:hypothetical protein